MKSIILLAVLFVSTAVTHAQNNVLFIENFTNGNYDNWEVFDDVEPRSGPSNWVVQNQVLRQTSNIWSYDPPAEFIYHLGTKVIAGDSSWANYSFNAVLRSTDNDGIGMIFRYQDEKNYYRILLMDDAGNSGSTQSAVQRIQKMVDGEPITLLQNEVNEAFPSGNFALSVDVRDDSIKVFLNHSLIGKVKDSEYSSGKIGLFTYANSGAYFDSITVSSDFFIYDEIEEFLPLQPVSQDRLPYIQNPTTTQVEIAWRSVEKTVGKVNFGTEKGVYSQSIIEDAPLQKHHVVIEGLQPDTRYYYQVLNNDAIVLQEESFKTAKPDSAKKFSFFVLGDSGVGNENQKKVNEAMEKSHNNDAADFLIHVGDVHQGDGSSYDDIYFKVYDSLIRKMNFFLSVGNHDTYTDNSAPYLDDFYLPHNNADSTERYYSFRWANAFYLSIDTNLDVKEGSPQYTFIENELKSERKNSAMWTFTYFHHPAYCEYWPEWNGHEGVRTDLLPLFEKYGVDIIFNGHTHAYERGKIFGETYQVITGGGGGSLDPFGRDVDFITHSEAAFHFSRVDINDNELTFSAIDVNGNIIDEFEIEKNVSVKNEEEHLIQKYEFNLQQNYPNPFNPETTIHYQLSESGFVKLEVFNMLGKKVQTLVSKYKPQGNHEVSFDAKSLSSGVYIVRINTGNYSDEIKMTLIK